MIRIFKYPLALFLMLQLNSCFFQSNEIYFDIGEQSINSCNPKAIRYLYITNDSTSEVFYISYADKVSKNIATKLYLDSISLSYNICRLWDEQKIKNAAFRLNPLSVYKIKRVQGNVKSYAITVWTDAQGKVIRTSNAECSSNWK